MMQKVEHVLDVETEEKALEITWMMMPLFVFNGECS